MSLQKKLAELAEELGKPEGDWLHDGRYDRVSRVDSHSESFSRDARHDPEKRRARKRRKRARDSGKKLSYEDTLVVVRTIVRSFIDARNEEALTVEGIAERHDLDKGRVHRALTQLRIDGLMNPPTNGAHPGTWRGGGYDDWSAWSPTKWTVRLA